MDIIFFLTGCLCLAETVDLFMEKDFLIFMGGGIKPEDYDLVKLYAVEKWLFAVDTLGFFGLALHIGGFTGDLILLTIILISLIFHVIIFKSSRFKRKKNEKGKKKR